MLARRTTVGQIDMVEVDDPIPGDDEVVVDLRFAGVNPFDAQVLNGRIGNASHPLILGAEGTGSLDCEPVYVSGAGLGATRDGTYATKVAVPRTAVHPLPASGGVGTFAVQLAEAVGARVIAHTGSQTNAARLSLWDLRSSWHSSPRLCGQASPTKGSRLCSTHSAACTCPRSSTLRS